MRRLIAILFALCALPAFAQDAAVVGTVQALSWGTGANPTGQSVTVDAGANLCVSYAAAYSGTNGAGMASITLGGASPDTVFEVPEVTATFEPWSQIAVWYDPSTGSQTLDPAFDAASTDGPAGLFACLENADTTGGVRDADGENTEATTALSVTLTTVSGDLVLKFDTRFNAALPALSSGWTSAGTQTNSNGLSTRLSTIEATGSTQVADAENEEYSTMIAFSVPDDPGGGGGPSLIVIGHNRRQR